MCFKNIIIMKENIVHALSAAFEANAKPEIAAKMEAYMRHQFPFMGLMQAERTAVSAPFLPLFLAEIKDKTMDIDDFIHQLWDKPEREYQHVAMMWVEKTEKLWTNDTGELWEYMLTHKSWWDTVDFIATHLVGKWMKKRPEMLPLIEQWNESDNIWLIRTSIIFQLLYKEKTDTALLTRMILPHIHSKEFFIQKAIGWALRQYSYKNPEFVKQFIAETPLMPLSKREGLKTILRKSL